MAKMRVKDKVTFGYSLGDIGNHIYEVVQVHTTQTLELAKERNAIMQELTTLAWKMNVKGKESQRIKWHYARRFKETNEQLKKLLDDMKIEYVYQQAGDAEQWIEMKR